LKDIDRKKICNNLLKNRDPENYIYDKINFKFHLNNIVKIYNIIRKKEKLNITSFFFTDKFDEDLKRRYGRIFKNAYKYDQKRLFLNVFCDSD
jgi:hypothetical protein